MKTRGKNIFIFFTVVPTLVLFLVFGLYPSLESIRMAFYQWSGLSPDKTFIGLENFVTLFNDAKIWQSLKNNFILLLIVPTLNMVLSLLFAFLITKFKFKESSFYRIIFFFPNVLSLVAISVLFSFVFHPTLGILDGLLRMLGLEELIHVWLGDPETVLFAIAVPMIWHAVGYYMVLFIASMQGIPESLYEAAHLDGASEWQQFRSITFPLIWEVVRISLVFNILNVFNSSFAFVNVMSAGGPDGASMVPSVYMYQQAFEYGNFGYAMSIGILILVIAIFIATIANRITSRESVEY